MPNAIRIAGGLLVFGLVVFIGATSANQHLLTVVIQTMMLAALATSWNILGGFAGQISLGHAVFFGIGALVTRALWLDGNPLALSALVALVVTAVIAAVIGIPLLRFRDIYFAIGTLALSVAVYITSGNLWPGISSLPAEALRSYSFTGPYFATLGVLLVTVGVSVWLKRSKVGLGMMSVRDDEEAAEATGINAFVHKEIALVISAVLAALAGASFAYFSVSYYPSFPFSVLWTFEAILVVFIGGIGTITGPLIGSVFFVLGREALPSDIEQFQAVLFGLLFIVVVLLLPGGLTEAAQRLFRTGRKGPDPAKTADKGKDRV